MKQQFEMLCLDVVFTMASFLSCDMVVATLACITGTAEGTWPRGGKAPPVSQRKKGGEKDVFKFLRSQDPNFTIRRQQQHMSRIFEKHQALKTASGSLM